MYNSHRGMVAAPNNRLTELLDQVRAEFENQAGRTGEYEQQSTFASCGKAMPLEFEMPFPIFQGRNPRDC